LAPLLMGDQNAERALPTCKTDILQRTHARKHHGQQNSPDATNNERNTQRPAMWFCTAVCMVS
jgi:hypothetical protein